MSEWYCVLFCESIVFLSIACGAVTFNNSFEDLPSVPVVTCVSLLLCILLLLPGLAITNFDAPLRVARAFSCIVVLHYTCSIVFDFLYNERIVTLILFANTIEDGEWQNAVRFKQLVAILPALLISAGCVIGCCNDSLQQQPMPGLGRAALLIIILVSNTQLMAHAHLQETISVSFFEQSVLNGHILIAGMALSIDLILTILNSFENNKICKFFGILIHVVMASLPVIVVMFTDVYATRFYSLNMSIVLLHACARCADAINLTQTRDKKTASMEEKKEVNTNVLNATHPVQNFTNYSQPNPSIEFEPNNATWNSIKIPGVENSTQDYSSPYATDDLKNAYILPSAPTWDEVAPNSYSLYNDSQFWPQNNQIYSVQAAPRRKLPLLGKNITRSNLYNRKEGVKSYKKNE